MAAGSGWEAFAIINQRPALSALMTDIMLGKGPDGCSVAEAFREVYPTAPMVYVSGYIQGVTRKVPGGVFLNTAYRPAIIAATLTALLVVERHDEQRH